MSYLNENDCLKDIIHKFYVEMDKLDYVDRITTNKNFERSFFLSNEDVSRIRARKSVLQELFTPVLNKIQGKDEKSPFNHLFHGSFNTSDKKITELNKKIDSMTKEQINSVFDTFLAKTRPIVDANVVKRGIQENAGYMSFDEKKSALMEHSFSDSWIFDWLAKLVKNVREALGIKTSSEELLEESRKAFSGFKNSP